MNETTKLILSRLPSRPILSPREISDAMGLATTSTVIMACRRGEIAATTTGGRYLIAHEAAERWIKSQEGRV